MAYIEDSSVELDSWRSHYFKGGFYFLWLEQIKAAGDRRLSTWLARLVPSEGAGRQEARPDQDLTKT